MTSTKELLSALDKAIGDNDQEQAVTQFIDTGYPPLNYALSGRYDGGLPFGRIVEMYGPSSAGKTALATAWMVAAQKMGGCAIFIDWERSFNQALAVNFGLNIERPHWIYKRPRTWEEGNLVAARACQLIRESKAIPDDAPILVVADSVAAAVPQSMVGKTIDDLNMNDTTALARVTSTTLKAINLHVTDFNATYLYLNQIRTKPGVVYGDPTTTPGGGAMEFYATCRMALGRKKLVEDRGGEKVLSGQVISIKVVKNKLTAPFKDAEIRMSFDEAGIAHLDVVTSTLEFMVLKGLLPYSKPRVTWIDGKQYFVKSLAEKIRSEGGEADLKALLLSKLAGKVAT